MRNKKIIFKPLTEYAENMHESPKPASRFLPSWYKNTSPFTVAGQGFQDVAKANKISQLTEINWHSTYKQCVPLVDSMTSGYILTSQAALMVAFDSSQEPALQSIRWMTEHQPIDQQPAEVLDNKYPIPYGYSPVMFRWHNDWKIQTPEGYSILVTHPFHRHDLPFMTITGVIDTDKHPNSIFMPFFVRKDFEGMIPEGTPIAQIIPFKRDQWVSESLKYDKDDKYGLEKIKQSFSRGYRNKFWSKKTYR
jgi:hypothetical protein